MSATEKQARFAAEYLLDMNVTRPAVRAGYSRRTAKAQASRLLTNIDVKALVQRKQSLLARCVEVRREDILRGLLETIEIARGQGDAQTMIRAAAEINKTLGSTRQKSALTRLSAGLARPISSV